MRDDIPSRLREHARAINVPETYHSHFQESLSRLLGCNPQVKFHFKILSEEEKLHATVFSRTPLTYSKNNTQQHFPTGSKSDTTPPQFPECHPTMQAYQSYADKSEFSAYNVHGKVTQRKANNLITAKSMYAY
jgi:hypothetical protein